MANRTSKRKQELRELIYGPKSNDHPRVVYVDIEEETIQLGTSGKLISLEEFDTMRDSPEFAYTLVLFEDHSGDQKPETPFASYFNIMRMSDEELEAELNEMTKEEREAIDAEFIKEDARALFNRLWKK